MVQVIYISGPAAATDGTPNPKLKEAGEVNARRQTALNGLSEITGDRPQRYRANLLDVGDCIAQDRQALLSHSSEGPVTTIDPVQNQTCALTPDLGTRAFGAGLATLEQCRKQYDPPDRLLNAYIRGILSS